MNPIVYDRPEVWKPVVGFEGRYEVSNNGRVRSLRFRGFGRPRLMKLTPTHNGYLSVHFRKNGKGVIVKVHRLVAFAFIGEPPNGCDQINHKNEITSDNHVENIEWCTAKYNSNYGHHCENVARSKIGSHLSDETRAKLSAIRKGMKPSKETIEKVRNKLRKIVACCFHDGTCFIFPSCAVASKAIRGYKCNISKCCNGKALKTYRGARWMFI